MNCALLFSSFVTYIILRALTLPDIGKMPVGQLPELQICVRIRHDSEQLYLDLLLQHLTKEF